MKAFREKKNQQKKSIVKDRGETVVFWKPRQIVFQKEDSEHPRPDPEIWRHGGWWWP